MHGWLLRLECLVVATTTTPACAPTPKPVIATTKEPIIAPTFEKERHHGAKDPRDVLRRARQAHKCKPEKVKRKVRKPKRLFDSTKGYPGEGPPRQKEGSSSSSSSGSPSDAMAALDLLCPLSVSNDEAKIAADVERVGRRAVAEHRKNLLREEKFGNPANREQKQYDFVKGGDGSVSLDMHRIKALRQRPQRDKPSRASGKPHREARGQLAHKPPRKQPKCFNCDQVGHRIADCPVSGGLKMEARVDLRKLVGPSRKVLKVARGDSSSDDDGDDHLPEAKEPPPAVPEDTPEEKLRKKRVRHRSNLYDKACGMMLTKDYGNVNDQEVIKRSLVAIARKDKMLDDFVDVSQVVLQEYERAFFDTYDQRVESAKNLSYSRNKRSNQSRLSRALDQFVKYVQLKDIAEVRGSDLQRLAQYEAIERLSRDREWFRLVWVVALIVRLLMIPAVEEILKRTGHLLPGAPLDRPTSFEPFHISNLFDIVPVFALCVWEVVHHRLGRTFVSLIGEFILRFFAHFLLSQWPVLFAFSIHVVWNTIALACHINFTTSRLWMLDVCEGDPDLDTNLSRVDICLDEHPMKMAETQPAFKVERQDPTCQPKQAMFGSWGVKGFIGTVFRSCSHNEELSMNGRVGKKLPAHSNPRRTQQIVGNWRRLTREILPFMNSNIRRVFRPVDYHEWASTFPAARRDALLQIRVDTNDMPDRGGMGAPLLTASSFIKKEIAVKEIGDQVYKDPRFIQGCPLELSAACGPYLRPWTKHVRQALRPKEHTLSEIRRGLQVVYTCGLTSQQIGAEFGKAIETIEMHMDEGDQLVVLEDDQSRFDLHLLQGPFAFLSQLYRLKLPRRVAYLLRRKLSKGRSNLGTKYSIPYTMQSGWPDTSVGDTLVNSAMKYRIHGIGNLWISIVCGDDSVTVTTKREIAKLGGLSGIIKSYADFGMEIEAKISTNPLEVEFCSGRFYPANGSYILMPKPGRIMSKICWDMKARNHNNRRAWLRGIAITLDNYGRVDPLLAAVGVGLHRQLGHGRTIVERDNEYKSQLKGAVDVTHMDVLRYYDQHYMMNERNVSDLICYLEQLSLNTLGDQPHLCEMARFDLA